MNDPHGSTATSAAITYGIGAAAAMVSHMGLNDWLVFLSIVLVVLRICYETHDFIQRKRDKKKNG